MDELIDRVHTCPKAAGVDRTYVAGEIEDDPTRPGTSQPDPSRLQPSGTRRPSDHPSCRKTLGLFAIIQALSVFCRPR